MVKERPDSQKLYDNDGYKKRAACVCVKNENENEVLLISSSRHKNCWIIPGGSIEVNENPEDAAEREVYEEAGVQGRLGRLLGIFEVFENKERKHRTNVYLLIVDKELEEWEEHQKLGRIRKWFKLDEAKNELEKHKPVQGSYLNLLKGFESVFYKNPNNPAHIANNNSTLIITYDETNDNHHHGHQCHNQNSSSTSSLPYSISSTSSLSSQHSSNSSFNSVMTTANLPANSSSTNLHMTPTSKQIASATTTASFSTNSDNNNYLNSNNNLIVNSGATPHK